MAIIKKKPPVATPEEFEGATLMRMISKNVKRVRYIDVTFNDTLTLVGGDNEQGKTSFLDSFGFCMGGKDAIQMQPIRNGQQEGFVRCDFGDGKLVQLSVMRTLKRLGDSEFTSDVDVEIPGHVPPTAIESFLKKLTGEYAFDPMELDRMTDAERLEAIQRLVAGFDFKAYALQRKKIYDRRTEVNRDKHREQSAVDAIMVRAESPCEQIDESALTRELEEAGRKNADRATRQAAREKAAEWIEQARDTIGNLDQDILGCVQQSELIRDTAIAQYQQQIDALQKAIEHSRKLCRETIERESAKLRAQAKDIEDKIADTEQRLAAAGELPQEIDAAAISAKLSQARTVNAEYAAWEQLRDRKAEHQKLANEHGTESDGLSKKIDALDAGKQKAIDEAKLPVGGIGFGDGYITLEASDGSGPTPWSQASEALRIDTSLALAMAMQPKLKVILIRNGSNIGKRIRQRIKERAGEQKYRVVLEVVEEGEGTHVIIEDGQVKGHESEKQPASKASA
jgi:hypothetical protein